MKGFAISIGMIVVCRAITFIALISLTPLNAFDIYDHCSVHGWFQAEYLYGKIQDSPRPIPLVIEGPITDLGLPVIADVGAKVVLGDEKIHYPWRSGGKFTLGFEGCGHCDYGGFEAAYFFLGKSFTKASAFSDGNQALVIPYFNVNTREESASAIALPGISSAEAHLRSWNRLQGAELTAVVQLPSLCYWSVGVLGGLRYINFCESLSFNTNTSLLALGAASIYYTKEKFNVNNHFFGAQLGSWLTFSYKDFLFQAKWKLGFGAICQSSDIEGALFTNNFSSVGRLERFKGAYFALKSNIGHHKQDRFSVVPEGEVKVGYQVTEHLKLKAGYNFLLITNVLRSAKQLNTRINPLQSVAYEGASLPPFTGKKKPKSHLRATNLWVQGLNIESEFLF